MTRRLRVGVVVPGWSSPADPGALPAVADLLGAASRDHDLRIVALRYPAERRTYRDGVGIPVTALGLGSRGGPVGRAAAITAGIRAVRRLHAAAPFDVIHGFWADEPGMIAGLAGRLLGRRSVVSVMGGELVGLADIGYGAQLGRGGRIATATALRTADLVTTGSASLFARVARMRPEVPVRQLPLGVDLARFSPPDGAPVGQRRLLFAGSLVPVKDPVLLLRAFARLDRPDVALDIAGDGPMRPDLERLAAGLGIAARVRFLGSVPRGELPGLLHGAWALVITSRHEAQSMVAVEAAACGVPVVGTDVGVVPELARAGGAILVDGRTPSAVASAMGRVLDPATRSVAGAAARRHAEHTWSSAAALERLLRAWHEPGGIPDGG